MSRRSVLKGAPTLAGAAAGSAPLGIPTIWAQEIKDIELRHVGVSYSVVKAHSAKVDTGFASECAPKSGALSGRPTAFHSA